LGSLSVERCQRSNKKTAAETDSEQSPIAAEGKKLEKIAFDFFESLRKAVASTLFSAPRKAIGIFNGFPGC